MTVKDSCGSKIYIILCFCFLPINQLIFAQTLNVGVVQMNLEPDLNANKNTLTEYIKEAKKLDCDLVVFPEMALSSNTYVEDDAYIDQLADAMEEIRNTVRENQICTVFCVRHLMTPGSKFINRLYALDPNGEILKIYDKLWDQNQSLPPGTIVVKGIATGLTICADRWLRTTTDLPLINAPVSIECSWSKLDTVYFPYGPVEGIHWWEIQKPDGSFLDCSPALGPYWIPRARRNNAYIICSGRRASIVYPNGTVYHCPDKREQLLVKKIDVSELDRKDAIERFTHPVFKRWWDQGTEMLNGKIVENHEPQIFFSDTAEVTIALAQIPVLNDIGTNLALIEQYISDAKSGHADLVIFPELSLTGHSENPSDIKQELIEKAIFKIRTKAKSNDIHVIFGSAFKENNKWYNTAFVINNVGEILTRYDQLSADNRIFSRGNSSQAMWFNIKNVHGAVTIGKDKRWEEIAELSACKGAQLLINISNEDLGKNDEYFRQSFSTFNTFTLFVNAAENEDMSACGKSRVYNDLGRPGGKYHAELVLEADGNPGLFFIKEQMKKQNPWLNKINQKNNTMIPWFHYGTEIIYSKSQ
jgi:predicted amidohydrolase